MFCFVYAAIWKTGYSAGCSGPPVGEASADTLYWQISLLRRKLLRLPLAHVDTPQFWRWMGTSLRSGAAATRHR